MEENMNIQDDVAVSVRPAHSSGGVALISGVVHQNQNDILISF